MPQSAPWILTMQRFTQVTGLGTKVAKALVYQSFNGVLKSPQREFSESHSPLPNNFIYVHL